VRHGQPANIIVAVPFDAVPLMDRGQLVLDVGHEAMPLRDRYGDTPQMRTIVMEDRLGNRIANLSVDPEFYLAVWMNLDMRALRFVLPRIMQVPGSARLDMCISFWCFR
jgi:hypothetical protein